jgi:hypothetical protein
MDNTIPWIITFPVTGSHNQTEELWRKYILISSLIVVPTTWAILMLGAVEFAGLWQKVIFCWKPNKDVTQ